RGSRLRLRQRSEALPPYLVGIAQAAVVAVRGARGPVPEAAIAAIPVPAVSFPEIERCKGAQAGEARLRFDEGSRAITDGGGLDRVVGLALDRAIHDRA